MKFNFGFDFDWGGTRKEKAQEKRSTALSTPTGQLWTALGYSPPGTTAVTNQSIKGLSPAWAAIRYISEAAASLPFGVYSWDFNDDGYESKFGHPVHPVISLRPHPHYTKYDFLQALIANACFGNGYARIHRDPATFLPTALELIPSHLVALAYGVDGDLFYWIQGTMYEKPINVVLPHTDVIHIKGVTFTGLQGDEIRIIHADNIGGSLSGQKYTKSFFFFFAHVAGILSTDNTLDQEQRENARNAWGDIYSGLEKVGKTAVLDGGLKYTKLGLSPEEAMLIDFRNLTTEECARIFKIPVHMISGLSNATYSNIEQQSLEFRQYTLPTWTEKVEQEFSYKLFTRREFIGRKAFAMFDYTPLQMADTDSMAKLIASAVGNGVMTGNEFRKMYKKKKMDGADRLYIMQNLVPVDRFDEVIDKQVSNEPKAVAQPETDPQETETNDEENGTPQASK